MATKAVHSRLVNFEAYNIAYWQLYLSVAFLSIKRTPYICNGIIIANSHLAVTHA